MAKKAKFYFSFYHSRNSNANKSNNSNTNKNNDNNKNRKSIFRWLLLRWLLPTINLCKTLRRNWILREPLLFGYWFPKHPLFWFARNSQLGHIWLRTPHYAAPVWLTGYHAATLVTSYFPPNTYLGKGRTSIEVRGILRMCLPSHT